MCLLSRCIPLVTRTRTPYPHLHGLPATRDQKLNSYEFRGGDWVIASVTYKCWVHFESFLLAYGMIAKPIKLVIQE